MSLAANKNKTICINFVRNSAAGIFNVLKGEELFCKQHQMFTIDYTGMGIERIGPQHQAGSDSLLTGAAFFKMREMFFEDNIDDAKYCGHLYGLGTSYVQNGTGYDNNVFGTTNHNSVTPHDETNSVSSNS